MPNPLKIAVLISGNGSNLQALIDTPNPHYQIVSVISNKANAYGLERAQKAQIPSYVIDHTHFSSRLEFDMALLKQIEQSGAQLIVLAGFMRILTPEFTKHFLGKMLNIHPSLLPKYTGLNTHQRALDAGDSEHGLSIHFVTEELDGGPVILQAKVAIQPDDTAETLQQKVHQKEHLAYPFAVNLIAKHEISWQNNQAWYQNQPLIRPILFEQ